MLRSSKSLSHLLRLFFLMEGKISCRLFIRGPSITQLWGSKNTWGRGGRTEATLRVLRAEGEYELQKSSEIGSTLTFTWLLSDSLELKGSWILMIWRGNSLYNNLKPCLLKNIKRADVTAVEHILSTKKKGDKKRGRVRQGTTSSEKSRPKEHWICLQNVAE